MQLSCLCPVCKKTRESEEEPYMLDLRFSYRCDTLRGSNRTSGQAALVCPDGISSSCNETKGVCRWQSPVAAAKSVAKSAKRVAIAASDKTVHCHRNTRTGGAQQAAQGAWFWRSLDRLGWTFFKTPKAGALAPAFQLSAHFRCTPVHYSCASFSHKPLPRRAARQFVPSGTNTAPSSACFSCGLVRTQASSNKEALV